MQKRSFVPTLTVLALALWVSACDQSEPDPPEGFFVATVRDADGDRMSGVQVVAVYGELDEAQTAAARGGGDTRAFRPFPHPVKGVGTIPVQVAQAGRVTITIGDGLRPQTVFDGTLNAGSHSFPYDFSGLDAGLHRIYATEGGSNASGGQAFYVTDGEAGEPNVQIDLGQTDADGFLVASRGSFLNAEGFLYLETTDETNTTLSSQPLDDSQTTLLLVARDGRQSRTVIQTPREGMSLDLTFTP